MFLSDYYQAHFQEINYGHKISLIAALCARNKALSDLTNPHVWTTLATKI